MFDNNIYNFVDPSNFVDSPTKIKSAYTNGIRVSLSHYPFSSSHVESYLSEDNLSPKRELLPTNSREQVFLICRQKSFYLKHVVIPDIVADMRWFRSP